MPTIDLAVTSLRELNQMLHDLGEGTNDTHWRVSIRAAAMPSPPASTPDVTIEIDGHAGYYCAGMNKHANIIINGKAGVGVAENMMSGHVHVKGDASAIRRRHGLRRTAADRRQCLGPLRHLDEGIDIVVKGSVGHMCAFMAQAGNLVVLGDAGDALGDSHLRGAPLRARRGEEPRRRLRREEAARRA